MAFFRFQAEEKCTLSLQILIVNRQQKVADNG